MVKKGLHSKIVIAVVFLGIIAHPGYAQLQGAIFTTLADGSRVNANIFQEMEDVYLDGGPSENAPSMAAALPQGDYYFQVTDPSGKTLLSLDPVKCRRFTVGEAGWIVSVGEADVLEKIKGKMTYVDCTHVTGDDLYDYGLETPDGAITVQLMPYKRTPNKGGVYKVWITPVDQFVGDSAEMAGTTQFHGFVPRWSKTDNYKVIRNGPPCYPVTILVRKFKDCNANGVWDEDEQELSDWSSIEVQKPAGDSQDFYKMPVEMLYAEEGLWTICESFNPFDWKQTALIVDGLPKEVSPCTYVEVFDECGGEAYEVIFGNVPLGCIKARKFYDRNGNGKEDTGEPPIAGIKIMLAGTAVNGTIVGPITELTDESGFARFCKLLPGDYTVTEILPGDTAYCKWLRTTPNSTVVSIDCSGKPDVDEVLFGNSSIKIVDFGTKGYWHNKNGLSELTWDFVDGTVNKLDPYCEPSEYFDGGDEPFDGFLTPSYALVEAAFNSDGDQIWNSGTFQSEVSHFLTDRNAGGDPREQLAQQLLAFIFNSQYRAGGPYNGAIIVGSNVIPIKALIEEAIEVWNSGSPTQQTTMQEYLEGFNSSDAVEVIAGQPCQIIY